MRNIVLCLMRMEGEQTRHRGGTVANLPTPVRTDGTGHDNAVATQGRCVVCSTNTRNKCFKCGVRLHYSDGKQCFAIYHQK